MHVSDERTGMGASGTALPTVTAQGWYLAGTWVVTGERKDGRVDPEHGLFGDGLGALELTARIERLTFGTESDPLVPAPPALGVVPVANADRVVTFGLSWYLTRHLKIAGNAVFESVLDRERSPAPQDGDFPTAVVQFQFAL
jgi:phosphate-selective porin